MTVRKGKQAAAFTRAVRAVEIQPQDAATVALAFRFARQIDALEGHRFESREIARIGTQYLAALRELGMTPAARKISMGGGKPAVPQSEKTPLQRQRDELAARRANKSAS